jgi:hypothetical protein
MGLLTMARKTRKTPITITLPPEIVAELEAERLGDSLSKVIEGRLLQSFKMGPVARHDSPIEAAELRLKLAKASAAEVEAKKQSGELIQREAVIEFVMRDYAVVRSRILNLPSAIIGLSPEQFADATRAAQDCMTDLSAARPAAWDDL